MLKLFRTKTFLKEYRKIKFSDKLYLKYVVYLPLFELVISLQIFYQFYLYHNLKSNRYKNDRVVLMF